jgi:hypothetical protein
MPQIGGHPYRKLQLFCPLPIQWVPAVLPVIITESERCIAMELQFTGKRAIVTGGSAGIGLAVGGESRRISCEPSCSNDKRGCNSLRGQNPSRHSLIPCRSSSEELTRGQLVLLRPLSPEGNSRDKFDAVRLRVVCTSLTPSTSLA